MSAPGTAEFTFPAQTPGKIVLTPEELKVLKECNSEGFYSRGIPTAVAVAACTFYAMKKGFVKPHARFGVLPGITVTGIIGCVAGSLSYKTICLERVLAIPNGTLRQQLEAMQGIKPGRPANLLSEKFELDVDRPMVSGSQMDFYQPSNDFDGFSGVNTDGDQHSNYDIVKPLPTYSPGIHTYDELRQRNRDDYMQSQAPRQYNPPPRSAAPRDPAYAPTTGPPGPIFEDIRPFDRDRVPQYHLD